MRFGILGRLEAERDGTAISLGSFKERSLLTLLLIHRDEVVSTDRIIDELWGEDAVGRQNALWVHISNLRSALEPDREKGSEGTVILTRSPGYLIPAVTCDLDAPRFEHLAAEGRALIPTDPAAAALVLGEALALWRGHALEDFTYENFAQAEIARLEEARLGTVEAKIDAELAAGRSRELVGELEGLVRQHPTRERFTAQLMLALYRSGRQTEALRAYHLVASRLGQELGLEPSADLRHLEGQIVSGDPALDATATTRLPGDAGPSGLSIRGYEMRERLREDPLGITYRAFQPSVGREVAVKVIRPGVADRPEFIRSFEDSARLAARLEQPHIVPIYDYWREPGNAFLVMRLMMERSLADRLAGGPLDHTATATMVDHIGSALDHAHRNGIVHGDVNAGNVLIDDAGNATLADFGIAAAAEVVAAGSARTLLTPETAPTVATDIAGLACVTASALTGRTGTIDELRVGLDPDLAQILGDAADPNGPFADITSFTTALISSLTAAPAPRAAGMIANPYKGLRPFEQPDVADFFGRTRLVDRLVARLGRPGRTGRFVAVVGPSGCGKSSLVKAGVLPALKGNAAPSSGGWFQVEVVPGRHPFEELETALLRVTVDPPGSLLRDLTAEGGLRRVVERVLPDDHGQLLIVVDQLEELFTMTAPDTANRFLDALADAATTEPSRVRIVATLRADFYDRPLSHRAFGELLREGTEVVTPMSPAELEQAITRPAGRLGIEFEPALVAEMVAEAAEHPAALPLLQYALTEVFERRRGRIIGLDAYHEIGGVSGALADRAEGLYHALDEQGRRAVRQVFLRLVTIGESTDDTRRRVLLSELRGLTDCGEAVPTVVESYGRHRLLSFDRDPITRTPTVEISHEAIIHGWERLDGWIEDARSELRDQRKISEAAAEWVRASCANDYLLRGPQLDRLAASVAAASLSLSPDEREFMSASLAERDRSRREDDERERRREEAEQRSRRRTRLLGAAVVVAVLIAFLGVFALYQRQQAKAAEQRAADIAEGNRIADLANRASDSHLAMLFSLAAADLLTEPNEPIPINAEEAMHLAAQKARLAYPPGDWPTGSIAQRAGSVGVFILPPDDLVAHLRAHLDRTFTVDECAEYGLPKPCPPPPGSLATPAESGPLDLDLAGVTSAIGASPAFAASAPPRVVILGPMNPDGGLGDEFEALGEASGMTVTYAWEDNPPATAMGWTETGHPPDIVWIAQPAIIPAGDAALGHIDLSAYLDRDTLITDYGRYSIQAATVADDGVWPSNDGRILGVPVKADVKALVWYPREAFTEAGYTVPESWDDLIALSDRIVADGRTPWCVGWSDGGFADGWPATDLLEGLVLRTAGLDGYDRWVRHEIPFDDPDVMAAAEALDQIVMTPGYVHGGPQVISRTPWFVASEPMYRPGEPDCWLTYQASFMTQYMPPNVDPDAAAGVFSLPPIETGGDAPVLGGAVYAVVLTDRPEVRDVVRWLASPEFGANWASVPGSEFLPANNRFDLDKFGSVGSIRRDMAAIVTDAWRHDAWRFDGSDMMPGPIGSWGDDGIGSFWQGMLDYADGKRTIEQVMHEIEADWVTLESNGS